MLSRLTEYFTSTETAPVREIAEASRTGPATVVLSGISSGLESSVYAIIAIAAALGVGIGLGDGNIQFTFYLVALTGMGMLATTGVVVSEDTFGPVADNAAGIAEMSGEFEGEPERIMVSLDAVGNTTKAVTKGFAIGSAVIASVALFASYVETIGGELNPAPSNVTGNRLFNNIAHADQRRRTRRSSSACSSVARSRSCSPRSPSAPSAAPPASWCRRSAASSPTAGSWPATKKPDYGPVIDICTAASLRELATPALLAVLTPVIIGFGINYLALGAFLAGVILTGQLMANFLSNSGGAWDNAKKYIEDGNEGGKGSEAHKAAVIGDTVGDPFKDTAGPALNPLIKVMNLVSLLILPGDHQPAERRRPLRDRRRRAGGADRRGGVLEAQGRRLRRGVRDRRRGDGETRPPRRQLRRRIAGSARPNFEVASLLRAIHVVATQPRVWSQAASDRRCRIDPASRCAAVLQVGRCRREHGIAEVADRIPADAVADVRGRAGVVLDAVVLDHDHPVRIGEVDASDEPTGRIPDHELMLRRREPLSDEHVREQSLGDTLRERSGLGSSLDHLPESTSTGPTLGREPGRRVPELLEGDELATYRVVDVRVEHDRAEPACEVEEGARHRGARDVVDLSSIQFVDGQALVHDEAVMAGPSPPWTGQLRDVGPAGR